MKNILVSGAGGFLGSELIRCLLKDSSVRTIALSRQKERLAGLFGACSNFELVSEIPQGIDVFINCAFPANANGEQLANGFDYVLDLYQKARNQDVGAVIHISTQSVYCQKKDAPATEKTVPDLGSKYAVGKYAVEKLTNAVFSDIPHTNLRMASLIGPSSDGRISNRFIKQVMAGKNLHIVADPQNFGFLDVRDAASGIAKYALINPAMWEEVLNLSSGLSYSLREIAECVVRVGSEFGFHSSVIIGDETGDIRNSMIDGKRFETLLDWKAQIPLEKTIRDAYSHYIKESEEQH